MHLSQIEVEGYRSIKDLWIKLGTVNVLVGPNGCGKSNLYRALWLLHAAANGEFARSIVAEGGMPSALWAGSRGKGPVRMRIAARLESIKYAFECGLPVPDNSMFMLDPEIKEEHVWVVDGASKVELLKRNRSSITARDDDGKRITYPNVVSPGESVLSELREPERFPELSVLRQEFLQWRFYHHFRTDVDSPLRLPQVGVRTPRLRSDGRDLAAALQTIIEIGDGPALRESIEQAFPGAQLYIDNNNGQFSLMMHMPGFHRAFTAQELSDGTLQYLCLLAALLSPRPASLVALNEPENSIHPDLYEALARLIAKASQNSQLWVTTHARELADLILEHTGAVPIELEKVDGATRIVGLRTDGERGDDDE